MNICCLAQVHFLWISYHICFMPPPIIVGGEHYVFGSPGRLSVVRSSVNIFGVTRYLCTWWRDFIEACHKYLSCEWEVMKRFSRSEVKGQGHSEVEVRPSTDGRCASGGGMPIDGVTSKLTPSPHTAVASQTVYHRSSRTPVTSKSFYNL